MASSTTNLGLRKPDPNENWSVQNDFNANMEKIDEAYREAVLSAYDETLAEIKGMGDMHWLFYAVLDYQQTNLKLSIDDVPSFKFEFVDQDSYRNELK